MIVIEILNFPVFSKANRKTEFQNAISKNDSKKVDKLIKKSSEEERVEGLITAVSLGKIDFVLQFLNFGVDVNSFDSGYNSALTKACTIQDNYEIVKLLLERGANINFQNASSETAANIVCKFSDNEEVLNLLIKYGLNVNYIATTSGKSLLIIAIENNNIKNAKVLVKSGANVNAKNASDDTPLICAVKTNSVDMVSFLIKNGASVNDKNKNNETALYYAICNNNMEIINELLANNATISINGDKGETLAKLAKKNNNYEILELLKTHGYVKSATELWNGFTDKMTQAQVIARADKILNAKGRRGVITSFDEYYGSPLVFLENKNKNHKIVPDIILQYISPNKEFYRYESAGYAMESVNVQFFFYKNKLYAIQINWNLNIEDFVIQKAIENYGNTYLTLHENTYYYSTGSSFHSEILFWEDDDRNIYLESTKGPADELQLFVFSKENLREYDTDIAKKQEYEQRQSETERKKTSENIKF